MSEDVDKDQKTEAPTGQRIDHAREDGQIPLGRDAAPVAGLVASALTLVALGGPLRNSLSSFFGEVATSAHRTPFGSLTTLAAKPALLALAVIAAGAGAAVAVTVAQTRLGFWEERAFPQLDRVFGGGRLMAMFSKDFLVDLGISILKVVAIGGTAWWASHEDFMALPRLLALPVTEQLGSVFWLLAKTAQPVLLVVALIAGLDLAVTHKRFFDKLKMSKEEVKREMKDDEGDPLLKGKRKKRHRELSRGRASLEVPRADALLVNPTHIAIALRYRKDEGRSPRVTAKGKGILAEYMRELARENGIPIVEDIPLARLLYRKVKVGREIPAQTYRAVATILAFVYRVTGRSAGPATTVGARLGPSTAQRT